jgi:hypothetical protein
MAEGHSLDGMNGFVSEEPHTSIATNTPKPAANAITIPILRLRATLRDVISKGFTLKAEAIANKTETAATKGVTMKT